MDSQDSKRSAIDHLDSITFKVGLKGYNVDEVDEYLERLSGEVTQLKEMVSQLRQQLRVAQERPVSGPATGQVPVAAPAPGVIQVGRVASSAESETVTSMISMAQKFVEQAKVDAEAKARELMSAAQERARELVADAKSRAEDEVTRLNGLKQRLGEDIESLSTRLESERARLTTVVVEFSRWIESSFQLGKAETNQPEVRVTEEQRPIVEVESFIAESPETAPVVEESLEVPPEAPAPVQAPVEEKKPYNASAGATWPPKPADR
jgi:DivIVA domain-containing protein